jgi:sec-independent protein translocase protein TatC
MTEQVEQPLLEHLRELRKRLIAIIAILIAGMILCYNFSQAVFNVLTKPYFDFFPPNSLIGTGPAEPFILKIKVAAFAGMLLMSPLIFHQIWLFISPGLLEHERKKVLPFVFITSSLFLLGTVICYYEILPFTFAFFKGEYDSVGLTPQIRISEHLSLVLQALFGFGIIFEVPVLSYFLAKLGIITHKTLIGGFRYAIVGIFIIAAILTPTPDIFNQCIFAFPLLILYGVSIIVAKLSEPKAIEEATQSS